ncbi:hypothetical protein MKW92_026283 [Papaver armeniacum]|nr:hypothetical protein MKW92_026283 [Papaver armeniacum]
MVKNSISESSSSYGISEEESITSAPAPDPEMLKNTPSNIARLEDVIDQCKGRHKYLVQTTSPSDGEDVRWYFCKIPLRINEVAASVPRTDIVGKSEYFRFSMRDSLALEASFLQREEDLLSCWWMEFAECSEGPRVHHVGAETKMNVQQQACSYGVDHSDELDAADEERVGVPVKGGLYEVDLIMRQCFPVYWTGENRRVLRGHWFGRKSGLDWLPVREDVAEQLEFAYRGQVWHRRRFQPSGLYAARVDLQGSSPGLHALFTGEDDNWEAWLNFGTAGFSDVISLRGNGIQLRRGYASPGSLKPTQDEIRQQKEEEMDDYCSQVPVRHLVFMVHGIGQRLEKANLVDDVGDFRHITSILAERHLTPYQRDTQRVLFIPCQVGATVHDVLYYMSPVYCQDIIDSVSSQLNQLYLKFMKRNPSYDGKKSVKISGTFFFSRFPYMVILWEVFCKYDILCHQHTLSSPFPMEWMYKEHVNDKEPKSEGTSKSPECPPPINLNHPNSESISKNLSLEEEKLCSQGSKIFSKEEDFEDPLVSSYHPSTSNSEETFSLTSNEKDQLSESKLQRASSFENDSEPQGDGLNTLLSQKEQLDLKRVNCKVPASDLDKVEAVISEDNDKDTIIKLLRSELNSLRAEIADLKSECGDEDHKKGHQGGEEVDSDRLKKSHPHLLPEVDNMHKSYRPYIRYTKLEFEVDTFFAAGSPLGVFLALRNIRIGIGKGQDYWQDESICEEMPCCQQMLNIFHPFDPVAYRIEPLVCKEYSNKRPVTIPYHRGGKRLHISFREFTEDLAARSQIVRNHLHSVRVKLLTLCHLGDGDNIEAESNQEAQERSYGSIMMEKLTGSKEGRIDHTLQDKTFQHPYISALKSHTNYWRDRDTALFILEHLYRDIPEEPDSPDESNSIISDNTISSSGRFYQSLTLLDEDLPLTFSDRNVIKEFSRKVKKQMNNRK